MSLAIDLVAAFCYVFGSENGTNGRFLPVFSVGVDSLPTTLWLPTHPPPSHSIGVLVVLVTPVKHYLQWPASQLTIHSIVNKQIHYK